MINSKGIDFNEELKKFEPVVEVEQYAEGITDVADMMELLSKLSGLEPNEQ